MRLESRKLLVDALEAVIAIEQFVQNRTFEDMGQDKLFRSGLYWQFAVLGEALAQLRRIDTESFGRITDSPRIVSFRNRIIHGYDVIQDGVTWQIIQESVPTLRRQVEQLLAS